MKVDINNNDRTSQGGDMGACVFGHFNKNHAIAKIMPRFAGFHNALNIMDILPAISGIGRIVLMIKTYQEVSSSEAFKYDAEMREKMYTWLSVEGARAVGNIVGLGFVFVIVDFVVDHKNGSGDVEMQPEIMDSDIWFEPYSSENNDRAYSAWLRDTIGERPDAKFHATTTEEEVVGAPRMDYQIWDNMDVNESDERYQAYVDGILNNEF